jgi:hypothetical protein
MIQGGLLLRGWPATRQVLVHPPEGPDARLKNRVSLNNQRLARPAQMPARIGPGRTGPDEQNPRERDHTLVAQDLGQ